MGQIHKEARARQRKELTEQIDRLQARLGKIEALIHKRETEEASEDRKGEAKKERAAKEREKPKSAAEKAEAARENKKYREKHQQEQKSKDSKSGGGSSDKKKSGLRKRSTDDLKAMRTKVKGQIAVAKQKLAAL
jgi:FKBP-type peptidyl-prolyl cis-trans isomerase